MQNSVSNENVQPNLKHFTLPWLSWYYTTFPIWSFAFLKWKRQKYPLLKRGKGVSMCFFVLRRKESGIWCARCPVRSIIYITHTCTHTVGVCKISYEMCMCVWEKENEREWEIRSDCCSFVSPCSVFTHANGPLPRSLGHLGFGFIIIRFNCET